MRLRTMRWQMETRAISGRSGTIGTVYDLHGLAFGTGHNIHGQRAKLKLWYKMYSWVFSRSAECH